MSIILRPIRPDDDQALASIIRKGIEEFDVPTEGTAHTDPTTDRLFEHFKAPGALYWVAEEDGVVLGGCGVYPTPGLPDKCAELVRFFLSAAARGKGLGLQLMEKTFISAKAAGWKQLYIESFAEMKRAVAMYEKAGFRYVPAALGNSGHHACTVWMVKDL
ncbi:GNAT family N-acetyltransferase [Chitinophaga vietnamensis]|uniref:GNAT family N-acetyltransferase n=1 Tax=Chitinophaga vietnamensis TaxID=2593957 RepID=UPI00117780A6|nr:GNAT family N-acetyltransferase [Chitinophaga vietnamensis]